MAKVNLSKAAELVKKNRTTIWRHIKSGKVSSERGLDGKPLLDISELIRVYGDLKIKATPENSQKQHNATHDYAELLVVIESLRKEQLEMKEQIAVLSNRLTSPPTFINTKNKSPEDDPDWPSEIKSLSDIRLRLEIKEKYS